MVTSVPAKPSFPSPRVGSAATTLGGKVYLFSGRGGISMAPIEENGSLLVFDPEASDWSVLSPINTKALHPEARSYHCLTSDGNDTIYIHTGCPTKGRLSDLWSFQVSKRLWTKLTSAPDPPRGGTSIAFYKRVAISHARLRRHKRTGWFFGHIRSRYGQMVYLEVHS
jgi:hypothetical protein